MSSKLELNNGKYIDDQMGNGVPDGGTTGQVLAKASNDDYDTEWVTGGGGGSGTVTSIATTSPITGGTITTTGTIGISQATTSTNGYLSSTDWNTFNGKGSGTVTSVTGTSPIISSGGNTPAISIPLGTSSADGYLSATDRTNFQTAYSNRITSLTTTGTGAATLVANVLNIPTPPTATFTSLTVTGSSGASTLLSGVLNVPTYTLSGLGGQPLATNLTSLSGLTYASTSFVKMTAAGTFSLDTNTYEPTLTKGNLTEATSSVLTISGGTSSVIGSGTSIQVKQASGTQSGYLSSTDWTTFNGKESGTVTSVATTGLISGGTITSTGTITTSMATGKLVGRYSASTGIMEEITVGSGLTLTGAGVLNNTAAPTPTGYYGAWQDNVTQTAAASNVGYAMIFRTVDLENEVRVVTNGTNLTRITFDNTGIYNLQFSSQFQNSNNQLADVTIWLRLNGVDVAGSSGYISVPNSHGGTDGHIVVSWNYLLSVVAGQYYELVWSTTDHTHVTMQYYAAGSPPPSTASVILTVTQQSGIMAGTGITAINSLTGSVQTLGVGTSGTDFAISSSGTSHTFNLPTASASNRGALSSSDWTNFNTGYTDRLKWDGGATGLVASTGRTSLGATTVGGNLFTLTNPSAITFLRVNADNTVSTLDASTFRTAIGAGTSSTTGTVTSVAALTLGTSGTDLTSTVANGTTTPVITLNVPDASATARGVITTAAQTIAGAKTFSTAPILSSLTASQILALDGSGNIQSLAVATYPSLTELSYVKGVTSSIQTQINSKQATLTNPVTGTGTNNEIAYFNTTGSTIGSLTTATYPSLTELSYVKGVTSAIQTQIGTKQDISLSAYTFRANNTAGTANATDNTFKSIAQQTYSGTISWTGTTAPSGTPTHSYRWSQVGKLVTLRITLIYSVAGSALTSVVCSLPSDLPAPEIVTGSTANSSYLYEGSGTLSSGVINGGASATVNGGISELKINSGGTGYEVQIYRFATSATTARATIQYFAA